MFDANQVQTYAPAAGHSNALVEVSAKLVPSSLPISSGRRKRTDSILEKGWRYCTRRPSFFAQNQEVGRGRGE